MSSVCPPVSPSHWPSVCFSVYLSVLMAMVVADAEGGAVNLRHGPERDGQRSDKFDMHVASSSECMSTVSTTPHCAVHVCVRL